ncbi:MAG: chemotaxis protein CheW [Nitrospiraceae bacterium]|nr:chemotaxis protein CheW [Nitrospiraceae bacterium]
MNKFAVFKIGDEDFGIIITSVVEILKLQKIYSLPQLPAFLAGVINLRGEVIPVLDLRVRFDISASNKKERIVIINFEQEKLGLIVDEMEEIVTIADEDISVPPVIFKGLRTEYLTGLGKKDEQVIIILNLDNLLTSEEKISLKESTELIGENNAGFNEAS